MIEKFYEIPNTRCYEYQTYEADGLTAWRDAGPATPETLARIKEALHNLVPTIPYQVREVCQVKDSSGTYAGVLIFSETVYQHDWE